MVKLSWLLLFVSLSVALAATIPLENQNETPTINERIVGGTDAVLGQFPYVVSLRTLLNSHFCGATIVALRFVLTAAHCTLGRDENGINIVGGSITLSSAGLVYRSIQIINHPNYNVNTFANDIAVIRTSTPFIISDTTQIINIGSTFADGNLVATISGWGLSSNPGVVPDTMRWLSVNTITNTECRSRHTLINALLIFDNTLCTFTRIGQGVCMGASGGPLVIGNDVVGIPSWVVPCGLGFPDVHARVSSHRDWIIGAIQV